MDTVGFVCGGLTFIVAICIGSYFAHRQMKANLDAWRESAKNWKKISATWKEEYYQQRKYADTMQREILKLMPPERRALIDGGLDLIKFSAEMELEKERKKIKNGTKDKDT